MAGHSDSLSGAEGGYCPSLRLVESFDDAVSERLVRLFQIAGSRFQYANLIHISSVPILA